MLDIILKLMKTFTHISPSKNPLPNMSLQSDDRLLSQLNKRFDLTRKTSCKIKRTSPKKQLCQKTRDNWHLDKTRTL